MREIIDTILCIPSAPFTLITLWGLLLSSALSLMLLRTSRRALVLMRVVFSIRLYQVCHFARQMPKRWVMRLCHLRYYLVGRLISLQAVLQTQIHLQVAVNLFCLHKKLMYHNLVGLLQNLGVVILEGHTGIVLENLLGVTHRRSPKTWWEFWYAWPHKNLLRSESLRP